MFGLKTMLGYGFNAIRGAVGLGSRSADDALTGLAGRHQRTINAQWRAAHPDVTEIPRDVLQANASMAQELAENSGMGWFKRTLATVGIGGGAAGAGLGIEAAVNGEDSLVAHGLENIMEAGKIPDAITDTASLFERFKEIVRQIAEFLSNPGEYIWNENTSGETLSVAPESDGGNPAAPEISAEDTVDNRSLTNQFTDYAEGLAADADPSQWSFRGYLNLQNAAVNGMAVGATSTVAWAGGQALDILNVGNVFSDRDFSTQFASATANGVNSAWDATIGAPDLSGHWAHALNQGGQIAAPAVGALKIGRVLSSIFSRTADVTAGLGRATDLTLRHAPSLVAAPTVP